MGVQKHFFPNKTPILGPRNVSYNLMYICAIRFQNFIFTRGGGGTNWGKKKCFSKKQNPGSHGSLTFYALDKSSFGRKSVVSYRRAVIFTIFSGDHLGLKNGSFL